MSNQKYYKNRLGFDPSEDHPDQNQYPHHPVVQRYASPAKSTPSRGGTPYDDYGSPMKKSRQSTPSNASNADTSGYEDALTQFKGNMSMWEFFVEAKDRDGMYRKLREKAAARDWKEVILPPIKVCRDFFY